MVALAQSSQDTVGPLLGNINFNQGVPYNNNCPVLAGEQNRRSVTGCVATAMAEVMRYFQYPACGTGEATYTSSNGAATFKFAEHPFDWNNILEDYDAQRYNSTQAAAVANLMLACGASINMQYSADGSGSFCDRAATALTTHFGYSSEIRHLEVTGVDTEDRLLNDWQYAIMDNLDHGWPVIFAGTAKSGGHCFVVDGYTIDGNDQSWFHINWGWGGAGNNWCLITNFASDPAENYTAYDCRMVFNIRPANWTGVENVPEDHDKAQKRMENGQLIIIKNGVRYNALGMMVE